MKEFNFISFVSTKEDGQMTSNKNFYPDVLFREDILRQMRENKQKVTSRLGTDYKKMFIPIQKNSTKDDLYKDGHMLVLNNGIISKYDDLYDFDYNCDIVKITRETPYVAICYPVADCALVSAVNMKTKEAVIAHCGGEYINRYLPMQLIDKLGGNEEDIRVHVSPFAHTLKYEHGAPNWISNEQVWDKCIREDFNGLIINQLGALIKMLKSRKIKEENLLIYPYDTTESELFYSNHNAHNGKSDDNGRFLAGVIYTDSYESNPFTMKFR